MLWDEKRHAKLLAGVKEVGRYQLGEVGRLGQSDLVLKGSRDLVTRVDQESEERLAALLAALLPEAGLLGEEQSRFRGESDLLWVVDPLDGTTNFAYQHPYFAISIALVRKRRPILGLIHAPRLGETFHGFDGFGAYVDGEPLKVSTRRDLSMSLLATGFADARLIHAETNLRNLDRLIHSTQGVRRAGSAALDLAFTAAGRLDAFWEMNLNPWDVAAGIYLVRAAGGRISDMRGGEDALSGTSIIASNGLLHDELSRQLELDPRFDLPPSPLFAD